MALISIRAACTCGARLAPMYGGAATYRYLRTCRKCRARWSVRVAPGQAVAGAVLHACDLECTRDAVTAKNDRRVRGPVSARRKVS